MNISGLRLPARRTGAAAGAKRGSFDLPFFVLTLLLLAIGVIMVLSSSFARAYAQGKSPTYYFVRQAGFAVAGVVGMILFSHVRMATYRRWSLLLLGVSIFLPVFHKALYIYALVVSIIFRSPAAVSFLISVLKKPPLHIVLRAVALNIALITDLRAFVNFHAVTIHHRAFRSSGKSRIIEPFTVRLVSA